MEKNKKSRDQSGYWADRDRSINKNVLRKKNRRNEYKIRKSRGYQK